MMDQKHSNFLSLVIAACALFLSIWQGHLQQVQNRAMVEPRLNAYFKIDGKTKQWGLYIFNNGLGPAYIEDIEVAVGGSSMEEGDVGRFYSAARALSLNTFCLTAGGPRQNDSFKVGEEIALLEISNDSPANCSYTQLFMKKIIDENLDFTVVVKSILGERFEYNFKKNIQIPL